MKRMRHVSVVRAASVLVCSAMAIAAAGVPGAQAAPKSVGAFFGNPSSLSASGLAGTFSTPQGIAVREVTGDIYVVDRDHGRIQRFSSAGQFELMWGKDVIRADAEIDINLGTGFEVCTYGPDCKAGASGSLGGEFTTPRAIAVSQTTGDVYVAERGGRVQAFTADGAFKWAQGKDVITDGSVSDPTGITTAQVCVVRLDCKAAAFGTLGGEYAFGGAIAFNSGGSGIAVVPTPGLLDPPLLNAGNVLVTDSRNRRVQELNPDGEFVRTFGWDVVTDGSGSDPTSVGTFQVCTVSVDCKAGASGPGSGPDADPGRFVTGEFDDTPNRVAVDSTGAIYTVENGGNFRVQKFTPQAGPPALSPSILNPDIGGPGPSLSLAGTAFSDSPRDIAIGGSDRVFIVKAFPPGVGAPEAEVSEQRVVELDSTGAFIETHAPRSGINGVMNLAVNRNSEEIYISTAGPGVDPGIYLINNSTVPVVELSVGTVEARKVELAGQVNPGGPDTLIGVRTRYRFEYRRVGAPTWTAVSVEKDAGNGFVDVEVAEVIEDLEADTDYEARLVALKPFSGEPNVESAPEPFTTPPSRPDIDAVYVTGRSEDGARLNARMNPNGQETSYRFEYGTTDDYGTTVPVPDGSAGAGKAPQVVSQPLTGLDPQTTYHYRVTATNINGTVESADGTFTTKPVSASPVGRAYELVSPADKIGGSGVGTWYAGVGSHGPTGIAALDGDRFASLSYYGASLAEGGFSYGSDWTLGERTSAGWVNRSAFSRPGGFGTAEFAKLATIDAASDDLSLTAWGGGGSQLSIFPEQPLTFGSALGATGGSALREWNSGRWEIAAPWASDQQTGGSFEMSLRVASAGGYALIQGGLRGVAGPGDPTGSPCVMSCSRNVFIDDVTAGLSDAFPGDGVRSLVNVCTGTGPSRTRIPSVDDDGKLTAAECPPAPAGRTARPISSRGASLATIGDYTGHSHMSADGGRVFFMSPSLFGVGRNSACVGAGAVGTKCPPQVYVRQRNADGSATTRWISRSVVDDQDASLLAAAVFEGATPDGDKVFFRTASPLTPDDPNGGMPKPDGVKAGVPNETSVDLYMYDFPNAPDADPGDGTLTRISAGPTGDGDSNVSTDAIDSRTNALRALGEDGSRVYFVTAARLKGVSAPANGTVTSPTGTAVQSAVKNLYVYDSGLPLDRRWRFVAQLPAHTPLGGCAAKGSQLGGDALGAGGNGTGVNGLVQAGGVGDAANCVRANADGSLISFFTDGRLTDDDPNDVTGDVYAYDATLGELTRLSAPQGDASGDSYVCVNDPLSGAALGARCHGDPRIASVGSVQLRPLNMVTDPIEPGDRTVFFESASRLLPEDQNDVYDVYQWHNGKLSLLSTGAPDADPALYRGNDRTGRNVYISTRDRLSWQDHDAVLDVYAARIDGGIPQPPAPPTCALLADGCQGGGTAPIPTPTPSSSTPVDHGNADTGDRRTLFAAAPSAKARRAAARSGILRLSVRANPAGRIVAVAKARIGKRSRVIARGSVRAKTRSAKLVLRLNRAAKRRLKSGKALVVTVRVSSPGARARTMTVRLPGVKS